jgi:hypothetical protein
MANLAKTSTGMVHTLKPNEQRAKCPIQVKDKMELKGDGDLAQETLFPFSGKTDDSSIREREKGDFIKEEQEVQSH